MPDRLLIFVTPRLHPCSYDEIWHKSLDDALGYVADNLAEWISCQFSEEEIVAEGVGFPKFIEGRLVDAADYAAVFDHGEMVSSPPERHEVVADAPAVVPAMSERLFHRVIPAPMCCRGQMHLRGNTSLHVLEYECRTCWKRLRVTATFEENPRPLPVDVDAIDDMP